LRGRKHVVRATGTLTEALSVLERQEFDVVVADMGMFGGAATTGLRAWLAANRPALAQRLILMSATAATALNGEDMPVHTPILQKPFKSGELLAAVEAVLSDVHAAPIER
jgi:DNA-binding response OmpR family regulator